MESIHVFYRIDGMMKGGVTDDSVNCLVIQVARNKEVNKMIIYNSHFYLLYLTNLYLF